MGKKVILGLFCLLFLFSFVSAAKVVTNIGNVGLQIFAPDYDQIKINQPFHLHVHAANLSDGLEVSNEVANCTLHLYDSTGSHTLEQNLSKDPNGIDWELYITAGNFSKLGKYAYRIYCINDVGGTVAGSFTVTPTGTELSTAKAIIYLISFSFLIFIFGLLIWLMFMIPEDTRDDEGFVINVSKLEYLRPILKGLAWIVLTSIVFIIANITIAYLSTGLMGSFLFLIFQLMMLSNLVIIPLMIIRMIQRITLSKDMLGLIERGVKFE